MVSTPLEMLLQGISSPKTPSLQKVGSEKNRSIFIIFIKILLIKQITFQINNFIHTYFCFSEINIGNLIKISDF